MAIYHLAMKPVSRSTGRSSVAAAAYRSGTCLSNERDGLVHDYTHKGGIEHSEIVVPEGVSAEWATDRERLWNAAEFVEKRKDARVAREFEVALPHELTRDERIELTRTFAQSLANRFGGAVDFSLHAPDDDMDVRNHHAHILMTTRQVGEDGLGDKTSLERENAWLKANDLPTTDVQLKALRLEWEEMTNLALARAGHDVRVDHRSHQDRGLSIEPTSHVGVHAHQMEQRGEQVERQRLEAEARARNAALIREDPNQVLQILSSEKSVFDKRDIARTLHRYINDDPAEFQGLLDRVMASEELVKLSDGRDDREGHSSASANPRYSTREMVDIETGMARAAADMSAASSHSVSSRHVVAAIEHQDDAIQRSVNIDLVQAVERGDISQSEAQKRWKVAGLSSEQVGAIEHITGDEQISVVVGYAGAGKSTMLAAAREAWEAQGYNVHGAALAGKAAEGLEESSGIESRTLASWDMRLRKGTASFSSKDVLVIDEAGMVGSRQLSRFIEVAHQSGAKVVLVGDPEQLQAIGAGAAFRSIAEEVGFVSLEEVRRQRSDWQKEASVAFASQRTGEALEAYAARGHIHLEDNAIAARAAIVRDYVADMDNRPDGTRIAMAHRRADVHALNLDIRRALQEKGDLPGLNEASLERATADVDGGRLTPSATDAVEVAYATDNGVRTFAAGDRIVFLQNDKELNVRNGMLGSVERVEQGRIYARVDGRRDTVEIDASSYKAFDHGYATTIHKTQGATVDKAYVLASTTMDRHMTYVAMTRHRDAASLYGAKDDFADIDALKARLGRSGAKETVLDYVDRDGRRRDTGDRAGANAAEAFARRRGIDREEEQWGEETRRSNLAPRADGIGGQDHRDRITVSREDETDKGVTSFSRESHSGATGGNADRNRRFMAALEAYADAGMEQVRATVEKRPLDPDAARRMREAAAEMKALAPKSVAMLAEAMRTDPATNRAMHELTGEERAKHLLMGMNKVAQRQKESGELDAAPEKGRDSLTPQRSIPEQAQDVMTAWRDLAARRGEAGSYGDRLRIEREMKGLVQRVRDNPEVERVLARSAKAQGGDMKGRTFAQEMVRIADRGRDKDLER